MFTTVVRRFKKPSSKIATNSCNFEEIEDLVKQGCEELRPLSVVMYGSATSKLRFNPSSSDVDLMVFLNYILTKEEGSAIKRKIQKLLGRKIDLVIMYNDKKPHDNIDMRDEVFYECVRCEGKTILGNDFKQYMDYSRKLFKAK